MILTLALLAFGGLAAPLSARSPQFYSEGGIAIRGYDTVAYFTTGVPVTGRREYAVMWRGAVWLFANRTNREAFEANPWAFAPQYGGYCAYGASLGVRDETDPEAWKIVNGKLYLVRSPLVREIWLRDIPGHIRRANANWPAILSH